VDGRSLGWRHHRQLGRYGTNELCGVLATNRRPNVVDVGMLASNEVTELGGDRVPSAAIVDDEDVLRSEVNEGTLEYLTGSFMITIVTWDDECSAMFWCSFDNADGLLHIQLDIGSSFFNRRTDGRSARDR
jgi:hypothetical protein